MTPKGSVAQDALHAQPVQEPRDTVAFLPAAQTKEHHLQRHLSYPWSLHCKQNPSLPREMHRAHTRPQPLDLKEKPGNMSRRLWGCRVVFVNGTICRAIPGQMGGTPPSLPSHSHGCSPWYKQCAHAPVCGHACDLTLSVSPSPTWACY